MTRQFREMGHRTALAVLLCSAVGLGLELFVSPNGSDTAAGTLAAPLASCAAAVRLASPHGSAGLTITFLPGVYPLTANTSCGTVSLSGSAAAPVLFRGRGDVVFDAKRPLDASNLKPVANATVAALINPAARGKIMTMPLPAWASGALEWGHGARSVPLTPSIYPNHGLAYVRRVFDQGAVYAEGRTKGPRPQCHLCEGSDKSTAAAPCGANISLAAQPGGDWQAELSAGPGFGGASLTGYFNADWYRETHHMAKVVRSQDNTSVQFASYSRYGICEALEGSSGSCGKAPGRFTVSGLLSEVDMPGEYWVDGAASMLYLWPIEGSEPALGVRSGPGLISLQDSSWVTVRDVTVTGSTGTAVSISGGGNNTVAGCVFKNSAGGVSLAGGYFNRVLGNDIIDVGSHIDSVGNPGDSLENIRPTNNLIANNHLTQRFGHGSAWQIRIRGTGDRFSHNLLHDSASQLLLPGGPLLMIDHNEIFNTGFSEGDGGVIYSGASLTAGYGMQYRENFVHHSLEVPGLHGRGGIYFDDHEGSVSNCSGNVMYKAAGRSFLVNGGAANNITHNLVINGGVGIYNQHADDMTRDLPLYDNGTLKRGDKGDYIWKTEQALGVPDFEALFSTLFAARFPTFGELLKVNSSTEGWASAARSNFRDNVFLNNSAGNICLLVSYHGTPTEPGEFCDSDLPHPGMPHLIDQTGSLEAEWSDFPHASQLEFVSPRHGFDTTRIGLRCDQWRRSIPVASMYRPYVKDFFDAVPSAGSGDYTPEAAAIRAGLASGKVLVENFTMPCPAVTKTDCHAIWVAWGECQANKQRLMRYTVEVEPAVGGTACLHQDGFVQAMGC